MSKSVFTQLVDGSISIDHNGETINNVPLPEWLKDIGLVLAEALPVKEEQEAIHKILVKFDALAGFNALALKQVLVSIRSLCRPSDVANPDLKGDKITRSILNHEKRAHAISGEFIPAGLRRPARELTTEEKQKNALKTLLKSGMTVAQIQAKLDNK